MFSQKNHHWRVGFFSGFVLIRCVVFFNAFLYSFTFGRVLWIFWTSNLQNQCTKHSKRICRSWTLAMPYFTLLYYLMWTIWGARKVELRENFGNKLIFCSLVSPFDVVVFSKFTFIVPALRQAEWMLDMENVRRHTFAAIITKLRTMPEKCESKWKKNLVDREECHFIEYKLNGVWIHNSIDIILAYVLLDFSCSSVRNVHFIHGRHFAIHHATKHIGKHKCTT